MLKSFFKKCVSKDLSRFVNNESGMTLPLLGLSLMTILAFMGLSVDIARLQLVQSRMSFALDAAGLAAGSTFNTTNLTTELNKYMQANFPQNYMGASTPLISSVVSADNTVIDLSASTQMPTVFMGIFGKTTMSLSSTSQITRQASGLEVVMALDNTGSMSGSKLTALKNAATSLVTILYGSKETVPDLWIGLVPFSQSVNVGTSHQGWINTAHYDSLDWGPKSWDGCVMARYDGNYDTLDTPPESASTQSDASFYAYYTPSTDNRPYPYNSYYYTNKNKWITNRSPLTYTSYFSSTRGPNVYCAQEMTPMSSDKNTILSGINSMAARGMTHINLGAIWAWHMLSPSWRGLWGGDMAADSLPLDYGTDHMNKAAIILTDGQNTMNTYTYTAYEYLSDGNLGTTNSSTAVTKLNDKLLAVCSAMKNNGIYVYTIVLGNPGTSTKNKMKSCATAENYYFDSPSSSELTSVFNAIADSLSNLRVSQ